MTYTPQNMEKALEIKQIEDYLGKGYRASNEQYAFYDVCWRKVAGHYVIQEQHRLKQYNRKLSVKPISEPSIIDILELDIDEDSVDRRCLELVRSKFPAAKRLVREVVKEVVLDFEGAAK